MLAGIYMDVAVQFFHQRARNIHIRLGHSERLPARTGAAVFVRVLYISRQPLAAELYRAEQGQVCKYRP